MVYLREEITRYTDDKKDSGFILFAESNTDSEGSWIKFDNPTYLIDVENNKKDISLFIPHEMVKELIDGLQKNILRRYDFFKNEE